jgi:hypothetical protein
MGTIGRFSESGNKYSGAIKAGKFLGIGITVNHVARIKKMNVLT